MSTYGGKMSSYPRAAPRLSQIKYRVRNFCRINSNIVYAEAVCANLGYESPGPSTRTPAISACGRSPSARTWSARADATASAYATSPAPLWAGPGSTRVAPGGSHDDGYLSASGSGAGWEAQLREPSCAVIEIIPPPIRKGGYLWKIPGHHTAAAARRR